MLERPRGLWEGHVVDTAYEIHHGIALPFPTVEGKSAGSAAAQGFLDGWKVGPLWGTMWHGVFESDSFRRAWLTRVAHAVGAGWRPAGCSGGFASRRERMLDNLADTIEEHVDIGALLAHTRVGKLS